MKKSLFICYLLISNSFLFAQKNDSIPSYNNEWGLNITGFANQFLSFNENDVNEGSYLFTYKYIKGVKAFRLGAGFLFSNTKTEGETNNAPLKSSVVDIDLRLGMEKQFAIGSRWLFTAGGDFLLGFSDISANSESNFGTINIKSKEWSVGVGPVLGIFFRFNSRVSIGTEGTVYLRYLNTKSSTDFGGIGGGEETDKSDGVNFATTTPLALYFAVRI